ncbi:hypothetical protein LQW54_007226 [Pestalotiopsis sp. IQ-011]
MLEESMEELHESNGDLQRLGEQMRKIKEITSEKIAVSDLKKQLPHEYAEFGMVRRASKAFHNALANAWSAKSHDGPPRTPGRHDVRFFLDTKVLDSVSMDMVVPLKLRVRSQVMQWVESGLQSPPDSTNSTGEDSQPKRRRVLGNAAEKSGSIVDQLKLARSLVAAVLKFHSTPWLAQYLTLRDISLFQSSKDLSKCLPTLHLDTSFVDSRFDEAMAGAREAGTGQEETMNTMARVTEDAKLDYGIRNMTLWCLGVILLQIGHWSRLAEPDNVRAVHRLSYQVPDIGPRYQQLARRCLECDFGYGEDLTRPRLQQAVYEKAYCELVSMIDIMDISEDELH